MTGQRRFGKTLWRVPVSILGGLLSSLAMPRENIWPLIFVSLALILISIRGLRFFPATIIGFLAGLSFYLSQIEWISLYLGPIPWLALSTLEAGIFAIGMGFLAITWTTLQRMQLGSFKPIVVAFGLATIWTAREWVSTNLPYGGFPWSRVSQTLSDSFLSGLVYFVGISGLTFATVFVVALSIQLVSKDGLEFRNSWLSIAMIAVIFLVPVIHKVPTSAESGTLTVAAVQGNANAGLFSNAKPGTFLKNHLAATELLLEHPRRNEIDFIVWPENASDINPQENEFAKLQISSVPKNFGVPFIFGAVTRAGADIFNSSLYFDETGNQVDQYDKKRPVPFAEYVPDRDFWYQLAPDLIGLVSRGYTFGTRDGIFNLDENKLGVLICFEIAIDQIGRDLVDSGAEIILSQTNNADFGRSDETFQQAALARLRAIETGRTIVNISTVGLSVIYLPDGSIVDELPIYTPGVMVEELPLRNSLTPAMLIAGFLDLILNLVALFLISWAIFERLSRRSRSHTA